MSFSDWITIVSILLAVLIAVFKFDEWEIIRLRQIEKYLLFPLLFLFLSGLAAFYQTNSHPNWIDFLWGNYGLQSGLWAIIWMGFFFIYSFFCWKKFTNAKPSGELIKKYIDYLDNYEPSKFSSMFRKYERYFFTSNNEKAWLPYELILTNEKWWSIAPNYFKELVFRYPNRFYIMDRDVLKSLLFAQLSNIPNSQITKELNAQWNGVYLSEETPILNIFLSSPYYIEASRNKNILLPSIKEIADEYFTSIQFFERDKPIFLLKPSNNSFKQVAPKLLIPFYFIQFVDCYWHQVFTTNAQVSGFFFYLTWTDKILDAAPEINSDYKSETLPNLFLCTVDRMLSNIGGWIRFLESENYSKFVWAAEHFVELNRWILFEIQDKHINKIPKEWFLIQIKYSLSRIIDCRNTFNDKFNPSFNNHLLSSSTINAAFEKLTDEDYYLDSEQQNSGYQWLKEFING